MALGVLNNLSAVYAENNLNKTNANLQTVLQQLSSGSKINSGADDAAGLSLVNGLGANSTALTQSSTNATEGVGLLQVADGALSQVTTLLDRAITLATEASNGTLNTAQASAANQEYQSILSEINNIGSTTTYNGNQVFIGSTVDIYTGDSSAKGGSIDSLYFASLSSASLGDTGGTVMQSSDGYFYDLTSGTTLATTGDSVSGTLTFAVTDATGSITTITESSSTMSGLITAINNAHIPGVTANLVTKSSVVTGSSSTNTGLEISNTNANVTISGSISDSTSGASSVSGAANTGATTAISYKFASGGDTTIDLSTTSLTSTAGAQLALKLINQAVTMVAAQDGYLGAQINTMSAISTVMSTQQENVLSAQNAVQATDYASATSNMSKYEVLTQTGIAALAQANSVQQEVTKLLQ
jgi:flagellin